LGPALDRGGKAVASAGLQVYSIRSGRMLEEQLEYNLLSRWRVGLDMDAPLVAPHSVQQESRPVAKLGYNQEIGTLPPPVVG